MIAAIYARLLLAPGLAAYGAARWPPLGRDVMEPGTGTFSLIIAIYGAIVATVVAAWNIYREATNRGRLRAQAVEANMIPPWVGATAKGELCIKVTNAGASRSF